MVSRAEKYLTHLGRLSGGAEPAVLHVESTKPDLNGVTVITYRNLPRDLTTALTYGLSLAAHPDWRHGRPELCLSVRSDNDVWPWALGRMAEGLRGECAFNDADVIDFGEPISPDSPMSAFVVYAPGVIDPADARIDVGVDASTSGRPDVIHLVGVYPIHETERRFIVAAGLEAFWKLDWDPYDVTRPPAV